MYLYDATGELNNRRWAICITDCYYNYLKENNKPCKTKLDDFDLEIPWEDFKLRKENN